jgi:uncharacterized protein YbaR (Trm112 family)
VNHEGLTVIDPLNEALITDDGKRIYPIDDGIPVLLEGEARALSADEKLG